MADMGSWIVWQAASGPNAGLAPPNGVFYGNSATRFADVTDGLSNTAFFSERILADFTNGVVSPIADVFFSPAAARRRSTTRCGVPGHQHLRPGQPVPAVHGRPLGQRPARLPPRHRRRTRGRAASSPRLARACRRAAGTRAGSTSCWATARSGSSRTRSTCRPGAPSAPGPAARSSARDSLLRRPDDHDTTSTAHRARSRRLIVALAAHSLRGLLGVRGGRQAPSTPRRPARPSRRPSTAGRGATPDSFASRLAADDGPGHGLDGRGEARRLQVADDGKEIGPNLHVPVNADAPDAAGEGGQEERLLRRRHQPDRHGLPRLPLEAPRPGGTTSMTPSPKKEFPCLPNRS